MAGSGRSPPCRSSANSSVGPEGLLSTKTHTLCSTGYIILYFQRNTWIYLLAPPRKGLAGIQRIYWALETTPPALCSQLCLWPAGRIRIFLPLTPCHYKPRKFLDTHVEMNRCGSVFLMHYLQLAAVGMEELCQPWGCPLQMQL